MQYLVLKFQYCPLDKTNISKLYEGAEGWPGFSQRSKMESFATIVSG